MLGPPGTIGLVSAESIFGQTENGPWTKLKFLPQVADCSTCAEREEERGVATSLLGRGCIYICIYMYVSDIGYKRNNVSPISRPFLMPILDNRV